MVAPPQWTAGQDSLRRTPVGNTPKFMPLDNSLNRDILHSLSFDSILSRCILDEEGTEEEENIMRFS